MTQDALNFVNQLVEDLEDDGYDLTKPVSDGPQVPAEGLARAILVGYIELGHRKTSYKGVEKISNDAVWLFELSGPKHAPREFEGVKEPWVVEVRTSVSRSEKSRHFKLFKQLNFDGSAKNPVQLVARKAAYLVSIRHRKWKRSNDPAEESGWTGLDVEVTDTAGAYTFTSGGYGKVRTQDPLTGDPLEIPVAAPLSKPRVFVWDHPNKPSWDSLFIEGEWPERKDEKTGEVTKPAQSKNRWQLRIKAALNFAGSPVEAFLASLETPPEAVALAAALPPIPTAPGAVRDPLAGVA